LLPLRGETGGGVYLSSGKRALWGRKWITPQRSHKGKPKPLSYVGARIDRSRNEFSCRAEPLLNAEGAKHN